MIAVEFSIKSSNILKQVVDWQNNHQWLSNNQVLFKKNAKLTSFMCKNLQNIPNLLFYTNVKRALWDFGVFFGQNELCEIVMRMQPQNGDWTWIDLSVNRLLRLAVAQSVGTCPQNLRMAGFWAQHGTVSMEYGLVVGEVPVRLLGKASLDQGTKTVTAQAAWHNNTGLLLCLSLFFGLLVGQKQWLEEFIEIVMPIFYHFVVQLGTINIWTEFAPVPHGTFFFSDTLYTDKDVISIVQKKSPNMSIIVSEEEAVQRCRSIWRNCFNWTGITGLQWRNW